MRLLVINWQDWMNPLGGGAEVYLYEVLSRLVRRGHHITLLVSRPHGAESYEQAEGFEIYRVGRRLNFNFLVPGAVKALLRHHHYDFIIDDLNKIPFYTPAFARRRHFGLMMHLFRKDIYREVGFFQASYVYLAETLIGACYRRTPFAVLSESSKQDLVRLGLPDENINIVYCGIDQAKYRPGPEEKESGLILYVGRLKRYKSVHHLIKVVPRLAQQRPALKVIVAGDGDARDELVRLVRAGSLERWVEFRFGISEEDKVRLYQRACVLVQPSVKEGWGLTVIEAGACGTPAVAARSPGLVESVQDGVTGYLYPYGDFDAMFQRISRLLDDRGTWQAMSRACRGWAAEFSWDKAAQKLESILLRLLAQSQGGVS